MWIKREEYSVKLSRGRKLKLWQFPLALAYTTTDFKSQGKTFTIPMLVDIKKPLRGSAPAASVYVQLSRARRLDQISIMRDFDASELNEKIPENLAKELEREKDKDKETEVRYRDTAHEVRAARFRRRRSGVYRGKWHRG